MVVICKDMEETLGDVEERSGAEKEVEESWDGGDGAWDVMEVEVCRAWDVVVVVTCRYNEEVGLCKV